MTDRPTYPKGKVPKDKELWKWAFDSFAGQKSGMLGLAISKYLYQYEGRHGNRVGFYNV